MIAEISNGRSIMSPGCSIIKISRSVVRGYALLLPVRNPTLFNQIRVHVVGVFVAEQIIEALHTRGREQSPHHDLLEREVQASVESAQVWGAARTQLVTAA